MTEMKVSQSGIAARYFFRHFFTWLIDMGMGSMTQFSYSVFGLNRHVTSTSSHEWGLLRSALPLRLELLKLSSVCQSPGKLQCRFQSVGLCCDPGIFISNCCCYLLVHIQCFESELLENTKKLVLWLIMQPGTLWSQQHCLNVSVGQGCDEFNSVHLTLAETIIEMNHSHDSILGEQCPGNLFKLGRKQNCWPI